MYKNLIVIDVPQHLEMFVIANNISYDNPIIVRILETTFTHSERMLYSVFDADEIEKELIEDIIEINGASNIDTNFVSMVYDLVYSLIQYFVPIMLVYDIYNTHKEILEIDESKIVISAKKKEF